MRKALIIGAIAALAGLGLLGYGLLGKALVFVDDGTVIEAGAVWPVGDKLFYRRGDKMDMIGSGRVVQIIDRFSISADAVNKRIAYYQHRLLQKKSGAQTEGVALSAAFDRYVPFITGPARWALPALVAVVFALFLGRFVRRRIAGARSAATKEITSVTDALDVIDPRAAEFKEIAGFFLRLYKTQMGADPEQAGEIAFLQPAGRGAGNLYELKVHVGDNWKTRRMTIGHLGEENRIKSQCFYVIYDSQLVVKVPSHPITDFSDYVAHIRFEEGIVRALLPRKCIVPNVSAIMSKFHHIQEAGALSPDQLEEKYIHMLETSPGAQECLKINGGFVFFMDFSGDFFLSHAMERLQRIDAQSVAAEDARLASDCHGFETKYGSGAGRLCFDQQSLYQRFAADIHRLREASGRETPISDDQGRLWFFSCLSNPNAPPPIHGLSERFKQSVADLLARLSEDQADLVQDYRKRLWLHARKSSFHRNRPKMAALVTNTLDLIAWLAAHRTAVRDLKPENLLVVGDPNQYPMFLSSEDRFSIGLIDLETAVAVPSANGTDCPEPRIGGTPAYATPSHFFTNGVLRRFYPAIDRILYLQDWQAAVGLVFEIVTGFRLFYRSALEIRHIIDAIRQAKTEQRPLDDVFAAANGRFWQIAVKEFREQSDKFSPRLAAVTAVVPESIQKTLRAFARAEAAATATRTRRLVADQSLVRGDAKKSHLTDCSSATILATIEKTRRTKGGAADRIVQFLEKLAETKHRQERFERLNRALKDPICRLSAGDITWLMFEHVSITMTARTDHLRTPAVRNEHLAQDAQPVQADPATLCATHILDPE